MVYGQVDISEDPLPQKIECTLGINGRWSCTIYDEDTTTHLGKLNSLIIPESKYNLSLSQRRIIIKQKKEEITMDSFFTP